MTDFHRWSSKRLVTTGGHYAYLKIAEGCDKHCTYCIIPKVRGNYRSVPMEQLLKEAKELAEGGVKELILVAQETTVYGQDIYGEKSLPSVCLRNFVRLMVSSGSVCCTVIRKRLTTNLIRGDEGRAEDLSLSGSANPACK